ncbi:hypothetical protein PYW07_001649 [Mythimna separata]|uniref:Uncharacterized protein n=1 Tax=Mythimna separata TaxID=271217 RepID=A0AAD7YVN7_MYTSE|nr:hypothetical protein PYW07_001649 [Mythimna separata]
MPENNGWILQNDQYHFKWFEGDQLPNYVSDSLTTVSETGEEEEDIDNDQPTNWSSDDEDTQDIDDYDDND